MLQQCGSCKTIIFWCCGLKTTAGVSGRDPPAGIQTNAKLAVHQLFYHSTATGSCRLQTPHCLYPQSATAKSQTVCFACMSACMLAQWTT